MFGIFESYWENCYSKKCHADNKWKSLQISPEIEVKDEETIMSKHVAIYCNRQIDETSRIVMRRKCQQIARFFGFFFSLFVKVYIISIPWKINGWSAFQSMHNTHTDTSNHTHTHIHIPSTIGQIVSARIGMLA